MPYFAYIVGEWVQKEGKMCLRNKSMDMGCAGYFLIWDKADLLYEYVLLTMKDGRP